jgi:hypothetical protein
MSSIEIKKYYAILYYTVDLIKRSHNLLSLFQSSYSYLKLLYYLLLL